MTLSRRDAGIDAGYRSLACAVVLKAVRDSAQPCHCPEATDFLVSPECKGLLRLAGIRWSVTAADVDQAANKLRNRRQRHKRRSRA